MEINEPDSELELKLDLQLLNQVPVTFNKWQKLEEELICFSCGELFSQPKTIFRVCILFVRSVYELPLTRKQKNFVVLCAKQHLMELN